MENNEVVELLKKQVKAAHLRNILLLIFVLIVATFALFMVKKIDEAMITVQHIDELTNEMSAEIDSLDIANLNVTIENMSKVSEDLETTMGNLKDVSDSFSNMFRFR